MAKETNKRERIHSIDLLKFLAALLITNSHMGALYQPKYSMLATGGAIGDALFFFCSGYLLYLGKNADLFNWYKRRVNRIFPTIFAVALISIVFLGADPSLKYTIVNGGGWFVQAIFVFYFIFWFVKRYFSERMWLVYIILTVTITAWFVWFWNKDVFVLYNGTYLRWPVYFTIMLMGASVRKRETEMLHDSACKEKSLWMWLGVLVVLLFGYYGYQLLEDNVPLLKETQIILVPVLMAIIFIFYKICSNRKVLGIYRSKSLYWALYGVSACCLEIYLSGGFVFGLGERMIKYFPVNILITFILVFVVAYLVKVFSNFLSQTFKSEDYDWKGMIKL